MSYFKAFIYIVHYKGYHDVRYNALFPFIDSCNAFEYLQFLVTLEMSCLSCILILSKGVAMN